MTGSPRRTLVTTALALLAAVAPLTPSATAAPQAPVAADAPAELDLSTSRAQWIDKNTLAWDVQGAAASQELVYARDGKLTVEDGGLVGEGQRIRLAPSDGGLTEAQRKKYPHLKSYAAFTVDPRDRDRVRHALTGQLVATRSSADGTLLTATGVQTQGILDDLYSTTATKAALGPRFRDGRPTLALWAPTAQSVSLELDASGWRCGATKPAACGPSPERGVGRASSTGTS